jgi:pimeloyl-ACP methyl ester carboxylesterase
MKSTQNPVTAEANVYVPSGAVALEGQLHVPESPVGVVLFAHGSGSSRHSPRNQFVARSLQAAHLATLLIDLLTPEEEAIDSETAHLRFDIDLLAERLVGAIDWLGADERARGLSIGLFGASTGAGAALLAAVQRPQAVKAVVSRGGRPDLAGPALMRAHAPTLLIVGGEDRPVIPLNREALELIAGPKELRIVPGATHLFEEPGALAEVARLATSWFTRYLGPG